MAKHDARGTHRSKPERRAARQAKRRRRVEMGAERPGRTWPGDDVLSAFARFDPMAPWPTVAPSILPVLKRVRHAYPAEAAPFQMQVPPGIWTGFGMDLGPAFAHVTPHHLDQWGVDPATLLGTALENLARACVSDPPIVEHVSVDGVGIVVIQGLGWGSSLVLAPDRLQPILGDRRWSLLTPVRNTLLALPEDAGVDLAVSLWDAIASGAHDELDVDPLIWTGTTVVADRAGSTGLVH